MLDRRLGDNITRHLLDIMRIVIHGRRNVQGVFVAIIGLVSDCRVLPRISLRRNHDGMPLRLIEDAELGPGPGSEENLYLGQEEKIRNIIQPF